MREILFRGKNIKTGEWEIGDLVYMFGKVPYIHKSYGEAEIYREVDPETVGQYTEQKDLEGNKIFEGDILKKLDDSLMVVWWNDEASAFVMVGDDEDDEIDGDVMLEAWFINSFELVGNKWDNPELLKEG